MDKKLLLGIVIGAIGGGTIGGVYYIVDFSYEGNVMKFEASFDDKELMCMVDMGNSIPLLDK